MSVEPEKYFMKSLVQNIQLLCRDHVMFCDNVEVIGHLFLNIDNGQKVDYIVNERCSKTNTVPVYKFNSHSYHAGPFNKESEKIERKRKKSLAKRRHSASEDESPTKVSRLMSPSQEIEIVETSYQEEEVPKVVFGTPPSTAISDTLIDKAEETIDDEDCPDTSLLPASEEYITFNATLSDVVKEELCFQTEELSNDGNNISGSITKMEGDSELNSEYRNNPDDIEYTIVEMGTKKGRCMLVDNIGYSYSVRRMTGKSTHWACTIRNKVIKCPATILQVQDSFKLGTRHHSHVPKPGLLTSTLITAEARAQATNDFVTPTSEVVERAMTVKGEEDYSVLPKQTNLKRMINRYRQIKRETTNNFCFKDTVSTVVNNVPVPGSS